MSRPGRLRRITRLCVLATACTALHLAAACSRLSETESAAVGTWNWHVWDDRIGYQHDGLISLRGDGQYSSSSEITHGEYTLADDGFGTHRHGWFVDGDRLCFVNSKEDWKNRRLDNPESQCDWRIRDCPGAACTVLMWDPTLEQHFELTRED